MHCHVVVLAGGAAAEAPPRQVLYLGRFFETSGYAEEARSYALGLVRLGFRVRILSLTGRLDATGLIPPDEETQLETMLHTPLDLDRAVCLQHQKPTTFFQTGCRAHVARTCYETDRLPPQWVAALRGMDAVLVPSRHNLEVFVASGLPPDRVRLVREGIDTARFRPGAPPLPLPGEAEFTFLSCFTWQDRKGWDVLLTAFLTAFRRGDGVRLVIHAQPYYHPPDAIRHQVEDLVRRLGLDPEAVPPVLLLLDPLPDAAMPSLYAACDAFVLPSRGEGWGRPYAEAMACGKPVIATAWGGHLDFLHDGNGYLVEVEGLVPVPESVDVPHFRGQRWAQPSVEHLRQVLRRVVERPDEAAARAARARAEIAAGWDVARAVQDLAAALAPYCDGR